MIFRHKKKNSPKKKKSEKNKTFVHIVLEKNIEFFSHSLFQKLT
jgi:hypothetical protein